LFSTIVNTVLYINIKLRFLIVFISFLMTFIISFLWWKDFLRESILGYHTHKLEVSLRSAILLFILSEIFFFISFFWAFYDGALSPTFDIGLSWPPIGISPLSVYSVPLLNTIILLTRGISVTLCHHSIINNYFYKSVYSLVLTIILGIYFLFIQWVEYSEASFSISDGIYGRTFL